MHHRAHTSAFIVGLSTVAFTFLGACETTPPDYGRTTTRPVDQRVSSEQGLASKDLVSATDNMTQSIASMPEFRDAPYRVQIVMDQVQNRTHMPARDFDIYLARIRANLNQSGARYNIGFVENRASLEAVRAREGAPQVDYQTKADYTLKGVFYDLPNRGSDYYLLTFQIVDLHDGQIVWEGSYEVKFA
ncbi:MAG: hypothetical protein KDA20_02470 [Phycisphaerales bacterium]|nr:hypothetical protein [Phycisphaerales bacterium]